MKISELKPGMRRVDVTAKIQEITPAREVTTRRGEQSRVATAVVNDDSGTVKLNLWNEQIDQVKPNDTVTIENGYVDSFRGETQLNVGRYGKLTVQP
ncbi:MAG TPA: OB-fold nucleic acid binding domain-containing protein [Candidatus Acidoferrales bacterium]|jgi:replication factor A1|nr:OB-fold nucleic acid binding domain-containing protein [Candidatus Acidoferrales bacterium]